MIGEIIGQYKIVRKIGEGGMATVYEAVHVRLGKRVAVKILNEELVRKTTIRQRFENEARIMAELNHPNIVNIFDYVDDGRVLAIIMELLEGISLKDYLKQKGKLSKKEAIEIFMQVLSAFDLAHQRGIIHRDIKPSNIFIETHKNNNVKILDFGIAKLLSTDHSTTQHGSQMGSPLYMSPEQVKDAKDVDNLSDIYSLGVVLFHMLAGKPPISDTTLSRFDIFNKIVYEPLPPLEGYPDIDPIIRKATQKNKYDRYLTCREFAADLRKVLEGQKVQPVLSRQSKSRTLSSTRHTPKKSTGKVKPVVKKKKKKSRQGVKVLWFVLIMALLGGGGYFGYMLYSGKNIDFLGGTKNQKPDSAKTVSVPKENTGSAGNKKTSGTKPFDVIIQNPENNLVARSVAVSPDGGYVLAGYSISPNSDDADLWIYKINYEGKKEWSKIYGGGKRDEAVSIIPVGDGYILAGNTKSKGAGKDDIWLMKVDRSGEFKWERTYGGKQSDKLLAVKPDGVGNLVLAAQTKSRRKGYQAYLLVVDENTGDKILEKTLGSSKKDRLFDIIVPGEKYVFGGSRNNKAWLLMTDRKLQIIEDKTFPAGTRIMALANRNNHFYLTGTTANDKAFVQMTNQNGNEMWDKYLTIGKKNMIETPVAVIPFSNTEFLVALNESNPNSGVGNAALLKINEQGRVLKTRSFKDQQKSVFINDVMKMNDGGILVVLELQDTNTNKHYTQLIKLNSDFSRR